MNPDRNQLKFFGLFILFLLFTSCMIQEPKIISGQSTQSIQVASKIEFSNYPTQSSSSSVWAQQPAIRLLDEEGKLVTTGPDAWAEIKIELYSGSGVLSGQASIYAVQGKAQFVGLKIDSSGDKILKVTKADLSMYGGAKELSLVGGSFTIAPTAASKLGLSGSSSIQPGTCNAYVLSSQDSGGNEVGLSSDQIIGLSITGSGSIYSDSNCTSAISSATLGNSVKSTVIYAKTFGHEYLKLFAAPFGISITSAELEIKSNVLVLSDFAFSNDFSVKCFVYTNGSVYCSDTGFINFPKAVSKISAGSGFKCGLLEDSSVWCTGAGTSGQLGNGTTDTSSTPVQVSNLGGPASELISGLYHSCAIVLISGVKQVKCWGANGSRLIGDLTTVTRTSATSVSLGLTGSQSVVSLSMSTGSVEKNYAVLNDGTVKTWGGGSATTFNPSTLSGVSTATSISSYNTSGMNHYCILNADKTASCWGTHNTYGELGSGNFTVYSSPNVVPGISDLSAIASNYLNSCALKSDGTLYCWGYFSNQITFVNGVGYTLQNQKNSSINSALVVSWVPKFKFIKSSYSYNASTSTTNNYFCGITINDNNFLCMKWHTGTNLPQVIFDTKSKPNQYVALEPSSTKIKSGICQKISLKLYKNTTAHTLPYSLNIGLSLPSGFGAIYSDPTCNQTISQSIIFSGQSSADVYFKAENTTTSPKFAYISLTSSDIATATMGVSVEVAGQPYDIGDVFEVNSSPGSCVGYSAQLVDSMGNLSNAGASGQTINVTTNDSTIVKAYSDSSCTTEINSIAISPGNYTKVFYLKLLQSCTGSQVNLTAPGLATSTAKAVGFYENCGCD